MEWLPKTLQDASRTHLREGQLRQLDWQKDSETDRQTDRQADRQTLKQADYRHTNTQTNRQTERQKEIERAIDNNIYSFQGEAQRNTRKLTERLYCTKIAKETERTQTANNPCSLFPFHAKPGPTRP